MKKSVLAACAGVLTMTMYAAPADAAVKPMPGSFTGYAFDACDAPSQAEMDDLRTNSPFWGVGVYIAGDNRLCDVQAELTPTWVETQAKKGWRILPITVGRQASCFQGAVTKIDDDPANSYAAAKAQGRAEANDTVDASQALGLAKGTTQWLDIEPFDIFQTDDCRRSMLAFVSGWTKKLHDLGYKSGFYSSSQTGILAIENARTLSPGSYVLPDQIWFAQDNGQVSVDSDVVADGAWKRQRIHQYTLDEQVTYGSTTLTIDFNWMEIGGGTKPGKAASHCGVRIDFPTYTTIRRGDTGSRVEALQCLLSKHGLYDGAINGRYGASTAAAVKVAQLDAGLAETGVTDRSTWTAVLSAGSRVFTKVGAGSDVVRRLQRALNAATLAKLNVTGVFDRKTESAVKSYQGGLALTQTGVVTSDVWELLQAGQR